MPKKEWFHKYTNYNEQLEAILEEKDFSTDVKSLLLSMLYKMETTYNDYAKVTGATENKKETIEEIIEIIKQSNEIELVEPNSDEIKKIQKKQQDYSSDKKEGKIICLPNEKILLNALYDLKDEKNIYLNEEYGIVRNSLPYILQKGKNVSKAEIIRDFDGWTWNTDFTAINNMDCNLIYKNLKLLLGVEFIKEWMNLDESYKSIEVLQKELEEYLSEKDARKFIILIFKLSIIIFCQINNKEKKRLKEELEINTVELEKVQDSSKLITDLTNEKIENIKRIEKIDELLNDKDKFDSELERRNNNNENIEILIPGQLSKNLKKQKKIAQKKIKEIDELLNPKKLVIYKQKLESNQEMLNSINEKEKKDEYLIELQKIFIKAIESKLKCITNKKELLEITYMIRYYNFIPFRNEEYIKDIHELKNKLDEVEKIIIERLQEEKIINKFSDNIKFDQKLVKKIFELRTIDLDNINIEFKKGEKTKIILYDEDTIEKGFEAKINSIKILKYNKRLWMFL